MTETEKLKKRLEKAGMSDAMKRREGSNIVRPDFDEKGRVIRPDQKGKKGKPEKITFEDGRKEGEEYSEAEDF